MNLCVVQTLEQFENWSGVFSLPLVAAWLALCLQTNTEYALLAVSEQACARYPENEISHNTPGRRCRQEFSNGFGILDQFENWSGVFPLPLVATLLPL